MKLISCNFDGYKNLKNCNIEPVNGLNLIYGKNAQGKTNFLEAISLFSGKISKEIGKASLININEKFAKLKIKFLNGEELNESKIFLGEKNKFSLNKVACRNLNEFFGSFYSVFFSPTSMQIVKGAPSVKRKFINTAISQIKPDFLKYFRQYERVLNQRNKILKLKSSFDLNLLEVYNIQLAKLGTIISIYRFDYISKIAELVSKNYKKISNNGENLKIFYKSTIFKESINSTYDNDKFRIYLNKLESSIKMDQKLGFTNFGPHKDDLVFEVDGLNLKNFGSQGQKKTSIIALKLAQAEIIFLISKRRPIILLDEVLSELDEFRQEYLINSLRNNQVFISCCSLTNKFNFKKNKIFIMNSGSIASN